MSDKKLRKKERKTFKEIEEEVQNKMKKDRQRTQVKKWETNLAKKSTIKKEWNNDWKEENRKEERLMKEVGQSGRRKVRLKGRKWIKEINKKGQGRKER